MNTTKLSVEQLMIRYSEIVNEAFVQVWNQSNSISEVSTKTGIKKNAIKRLIKIYRKLNIKMKYME